MVHGSKAWPQTIRLEDIDGSNGFEVLHDKKEMLQSEFLTTGDFNGDNIEDLAISNPFYDSSDKMGAGAVWVVFGGASRSSSTLNVSSLDGSNGFVMVGDTGARGIGASLNSGDFNGDGITDLVMGSFGATVSGGKVYMVYGRREPFEASYVLDSKVLNGTNNGVVLESSGELQVFFVRVGDYNRDGIADMILFSSFMNEIVVMFGSTNISSPYRIDYINGTNGFRVTIRDTQNYIMVYPVAQQIDSDFDGDGCLDILSDWVIKGAEFTKLNVRRILLKTPRAQKKGDDRSPSGILIVGICIVITITIVLAVIMILKKQRSTIRTERKNTKNDEIPVPRFLDEANPKGLIHVGKAA